MTVKPVTDPAIIRTVLAVVRAPARRERSPVTRDRVAAGEAARMTNGRTSAPAQPVLQ